MPFSDVRVPAIGVSLLKAALKQIGVSTKIHYFNLKLAERIGLELSQRLMDVGRDSAMIGELIMEALKLEWLTNRFDTLQSKNPNRNTYGELRYFVLCLHKTIKIISAYIQFFRLHLWTRLSLSTTIVTAYELC